MNEWIWDSYGYFLFTTTTQTTAQVTGGGGVRGSRGRRSEGPHHHQQGFMIISLRQEPPLLVNLKNYCRKKQEKIFFTMAVTNTSNHLSNDILLFWSINELSWRVCQFFSKDSSMNSIWDVIKFYLRRPLKYTLYTFMPPCIPTKWHETTIVRCAMRRGQLRSKKIEKAKANNYLPYNPYLAPTLISAPSLF